MYRLIHFLTLACMAALAAHAESAATLRGVVIDPSGAAVAHATVEMKQASGPVIAVAVTDETGGFTWHAVPRGVYQLRVAARDFASRELAVGISSGVPEPLRIKLEPEGIYTKVIVSATRGGVQETASSPHVSALKARDELAQRPMLTIGNVLEREPGILVQQSTSAQVSPFLRGLTGYQVLNLIDGVRFNNSTFRSGPNQYLAFIEPGQAHRVETLLGPNGAQYGSDSLGGTINIVTPEQRFASSGWEAHGEVSAFGASADGSGSGSSRFDFGTERIALLLGASGRRHDDIRFGQGRDSHNVFHRLFGMPLAGVTDLVGSRPQGTGFSQYGVQGKMAARVRPDQIFSVWYQRGVQYGVQSYKDLLGGLGRLQSTFEPQALDFFYARYEKLGLSVFDSVSGTFSVNSQTDGGTRQALLELDPITREHNGVVSYGYSSQATTHWSDRFLMTFGGEIYDEHVRSSRSVVRPPQAAAQLVRPLYPHRSKYQTFGAFGQTSTELVRNKLRIGLGGRFTNVSFSTNEDASFGVPKSSQSFRDLTYNTSVSWQMTSVLGVHGLIGRGFRAPNLNDLGAIGLNDLGYEIPAAEAIPGGALLSADAGEGALSRGERLRKLGPESLMNYEFGVRFAVRKLRARVQVFDAELTDPIVRRTLLFPADAVPVQLAGLPVSPIAQTAGQQAQGVVTVATPLDPRAVKAFVNDGRSKYYGIESLLQYAISSRWSLNANYSILAGRDLNPNRTARRLPPQAGSATLRYLPSGRRVWVEVSMTASGAQERLSGGDRDDERIGASRRRRDIADFFQGARVRPYVDLGTGVFRPSSETLRQIQDRVLPIGAVINGVRVVDDNTRVPLYLTTAGWTSLSVRSGVPLGERWHVMCGVENVLDKNYRVHGSGIDAPGLNAYVGIRWMF